jgi:hypothetical protein
MPHVIIHDELRPSPRRVQSGGTATKGEEFFTTKRTKVTKKLRGINSFPPFVLFVSFVVNSYSSEHA